ANLAALAARHCAEETIPTRTATPDWVRQGTTSLVSASSRGLITDGSTTRRTGGNPREDPQSQTRARCCVVAPPRRPGTYRSRESQNYGARERRHGPRAG